VTELITLTQVRAAAQRVLERFPADHINPRAYDFSDGCLYTYDDGSHCVAGEVLLVLGLPLPELGTDANSKSLGHSFFRSVHDRLTHGAVAWLAAVQHHADRFESWRECVRRADLDRGMRSTA
jgi:hypothetical protein